MYVNAEMMMDYNMIVARIKGDDEQARYLFVLWRATKRVGEWKGSERIEAQISSIQIGDCYHGDVDDGDAWKV